MPRGIQKKGIIREEKMLSAAIELFLKNGYEKTSTASIAKAAGLSASSFFAAFENKEALLRRLVEKMYEAQFLQSDALLPDKGDPVFLYSVETALQLHITELSEPLRELYVAAYTLPTTAEYIITQTAKSCRSSLRTFCRTPRQRTFMKWIWPPPASPAVLWPDPAIFTLPWRTSSPVISAAT